MKNNQKQTWIYEECQAVKGLVFDCEVTMQRICLSTHCGNLCVWVHVNTISNVNSAYRTLGVQAMWRKGWLHLSVMRQAWGRAGCIWKQ